MRKILSALLFFSLAAGAIQAPLRAEDSPDLPASAAVSGAGSGQHDTSPPATDQHAQGRDDMAVFTRNAAHRPLVSAEALLRLLAGLKPAEVDAFRQKHCGTIAELVDSLERAAASGRVSREDYEEFTSKFSLFEIPTIQGRTQEPTGGTPGHHKRDNPVAALVDVRIAANSGDTQKTEAAIAAASTAYPDNPSVQAAAASYYNETKNYAMAEKTASNAIALDENSPAAYKARALARASLEDRKGAIEDIKKAMAIDPQDESARVLSALLESRKSAATLRSVASVEEIKRALGAYDESPEAVQGAGAAGEGGDRAAVQQQAPDYARSKAYLKTALSKTSLGDYEQAVRYSGLAIEKDPANNEAYLERANAYNFLGRYDDAVRDATHVIGKEPANLQAFNMRAWALNRKGQAAAAESDASRAIGLNPGFADAWFNRALAYEKQGDYRRMLEDFKQAASLSGAYAARYQDAVAQYGPRVPGFAGQGAALAAKAAGGEPGRGGKRNPMSRFLLTLFFTLTGGAMVAMGLIHVVTSGRETRAVAAARATHPDVLSPSVFYEGVATGKYKIERKLGEGAMGVVYEATDQSLGRKVAIKKMGDEIKVNEREKQRFLEEARTVALLHHPNIVEIYTIFEEDDNIYLVFEHVDGTPLDKVLDKEARLPFEQAAQLFGETAGALAYAHSKNVVHRDLKLSNLMLSAEGWVKVMDFGLARRAKESLARASSKEVVGSPAYMSPEQDLGVSSPESDIYALGVCFYEALSGVLPFQGPDFHHQKTHPSYQKLSEMVPGLPKGVDALVAKCLSPDPESRFHSAEDFRRALDAIV
jgi:tetratricopeptide (TPR) repeat protein/tRNA A-37 threonylcarbamoyl transferase component Bud32